MRQTLFRAEAIEHNRPTLAGEVLAAHPLPFRTVALVCLLLAGVIVVFACLGEYTPKVRARGYLEHTTTSTAHAGEFRPLRAMLLVPNRSIGLVSRGQSVALRYDALPFQRFGSFRGTVLEIADAPIAASSEMYRVTVKLAPHVVSTADHTLPDPTQPLRAGMELQADVLLKPERLIEWIVRPMFGTTKFGTEKSGPEKFNTEKFEPGLRN